MHAHQVIMYALVLLLHVWIPCKALIRGAAHTPRLNPALSEARLELADRSGDGRWVLHKEEARRAMSARWRLIRCQMCDGVGCAGPSQRVKQKVDN